MIWHFLDGHPDSRPGLSSLNAKFTTATLSNGNTALLTDLATHAALPYARIISAEDFGAYKPDPSVYLGAAAKLGLQPGECALVAAHLGDLAAASKCGFQTVYVERKREEAWDAQRVEDARREGWVDMWIREGEGGFEEIARRFGCAEGEGGTGVEEGRGLGAEESRKIEEDAKKGVFHEDASIVG